MKARSYKELIVWQKAMEAARLVYLVVKKLPKEETYALSDQMRRSAVSIPSNIAEGYARNSTKEYLQFLAIANGSRAELETQLQISVDIGYLTVNDINNLVMILEEVGKIISATKKTLTSNL